MLRRNTSKKGKINAGGCDVVGLAKKYGTPLCVIDKGTIKSRALEYLNTLKKYYPDFLVLYAAKAFACKAIFKIIKDLGLGIDVVSQGELLLALKTNFERKKIFFHGNNKSYEEIETAIKNQIGRIVCDNFYELQLLQATAKKYNKIVNILLRLTPGIECHTHDYIKTGHLDSKFGFDLFDFNKVLNFLYAKGKNLSLKGLHAHIGSQIFEIKPFCETIDILLSKFIYVKRKYNVELSELNIGGGLGILYTQADDPITIHDWAKIISNKIKSKCKKLNIKLPKLICEPGRSIIGPSGITIYTAGSIKKVPNSTKYVSVDGGMADNPRPITYQAKYTAHVANKVGFKKLERVTIAGKYCETGDLLIKDIYLPKIQSGDIIVVFNTGAYNYSMSSNYNMSLRPACVLVSGGKSEIIIERENYKDLIRKQKISSL